ncbi:MAG TPA: hypothetical protein EYP56_14595, partial [Planctomycetaceae bacterium]|nr:hypothetical protein [Planctomycetaceae bacterium]
MTVRISMIALFLLAACAVGLIALLVNRKTRPLGVAILVVPAVLMAVRLIARQRGLTAEYQCVVRHHAQQRLAHMEAEKAARTSGEPPAEQAIQNDSPPAGGSRPEAEAGQPATGTKPPGGVEPARPARPGGVLRAIGPAMARAADRIEDVEDAGPDVQPSAVGSPAGATEGNLQRDVEASATETDPEQRPPWVDAPPHREGNLFLMTASVGPYADQAECQQHLAEA